jgi:DNA-directed RNA polymerase subunit M/transcription elongation factor TFIIS
MVKFCDNCNSIIAFKKMKIWDSTKKVSSTETKPYCAKCGILDEVVDTNSYKLVQKIDHSLDESIVIDRVQALQDAKEKMGYRDHGSACPECKSFYFTAHRVVTRGDEAGKTFLMCLVCGKMFRRPIYIPPQSSSEK